VLDAIHLERMGIPALTFVTRPFVAAARAVAAIEGLPGLPLVVISHDYLSESEPAIRAKVHASIDEIVAGLFSIQGSDEP
jgi:hypothetical protein